MKSEDKIIFLTDETKKDFAPNSSYESIRDYQELKIK